MTNDPGSIAVADPEGERRGRLPLLKKKDREREKGGGGGGSSVPLLSISACIHSPVKCNKSLYIFIRCIAKIHPFYKYFNTNYPIFN